MKRHIGFCIFFVFSFFSLFAANSRDALSFVENKGQWDDCVRFKSEFRGGALFLEETAVTFLMRHPDDMENFRSRKFAPASENLPDPVVRTYAYRVRFLNASPRALEGERKFPEYHNYYLGKDPQHWASDVHLYHGVRYSQLYEGIDLLYTSVKSSYKYEFFLHPQARPEQIVMRYDGVDKIRLKEGNLHIKTGDYESVELKPYAYQEDEQGNRAEVPCQFVVRGNQVTFRLGDYDRSQRLVIDPVMVFCSYTGSYADNWGYTATYDRHGNMYGGGVAFGSGYPTTLGAFQTNYALGGSCDISITKFSEDGTTILFSTYLGGNGSEVPHSLVVNDNDELFVLASTSSDDFPVTASAFDTAFCTTASPLYFVLTNTIYYVGGIDIAVAKFNASGTQLMGSTYFGGSGYDGLATDVSLRKNYADEVRGEIMVDAYSNVYIVSSTASRDLPVTATAFQRQYGGGKQDGCIAKFSYDLQHLIWCSYLGGDSSDALYSMVLDKANNLYVCGGTLSQQLPVSASALQKSYGGGNGDGFVAHISTNGNQLKALTYVGKEGYDQTYLIKRDQADHLYVMGLTDAKDSSWIRNARWFTLGGGQFIMKLSADLSTVHWSTAFGSGLRNGPDLSPTALMVDLCGHVYFSGWGSPNVNAHVGNRDCGTRGLPLSADALKLTTDNNDFYFLTLDANASNLLFGSFFGGNFTGDHVDGGTSRFDRKGYIYQAICASCGGASDLPVSSNAAAPKNNSANCNLGVVKVDFNINEVVADFSMPNVVCAPYVVTFDNSSRVVADSSTVFYWDFGDGTSSSIKSPTHLYTESGTYRVVLIVSDTSSCNSSDTLAKDLLVLSNSMDTLPDVTICKGDFIQIGIQPANSSNITYSWFPADGLSSTSISNPIASDTTDRTYYMTITDGNCVDTLRVRVRVVELSITDLPENLRGCAGDSLHIIPQTDGSAIYQWSSTPLFTDTLNRSLSSPVLHLGNLHSAVYYFKMQNGYCQLTDSVKVIASVLQIQPFLDDTVCWGDTVCYQANVTYSLGDTVYYRWHTLLPALSDSSEASFCVRADRRETVRVEVTNQVGCRTADTFQVRVDSVGAALQVRHIRCAGQRNGSISLLPTSGYSPFRYTWNPGVSNSATASDLGAGTYDVILEDAAGCRVTYRVQLTEPLPLRIEVVDSNLQSSCDTLCSAYAELRLRGGEPPYAYRWNTGDTALSQRNLCTGEYRLYVEDARQCRDTFAFTVWDTSRFSVSIQQNNVSCYGMCNGAILLIPNGVPPYSYQWSTGGNTRYENQLCAGVYPVLVEDSAHCKRLVFPEILEPQPLHIDSVTTHAPACSGESSGWIRVYVSGGTPKKSSSASSDGYTYVWNGVEGEGLLSGLTAGRYRLQVTDSNGCVLDTLFVLNDFDSITCEIHAGKVPCEEVCNASASAFVQGGGLPYSYRWDNGDTAAVAAGLCYGTHSLVVTDANGCVRNFPFFVSDSSTFSQRITAWASSYIIYAGEQDTLYVTDLGAGFRYLWSPAEGLSSATRTQVVAEPDESTVYEVWVVDTFGCKLSDTVAIVVEHIVCDNPYVYVPNSFSPNGDGLNDLLYVRGEVVQSLYFAIYDRWGECVFETRDQQTGWDGSFRGKACETGVYVYYLKVRCKGNVENLIRGNVTLIR